LRLPLANLGIDMPTQFALIHRALASMTLAFATVLFLAACGSSPSGRLESLPLSVFTVRAQGQVAIVRVLTRAPVCPAIVWDNQSAQAMTTRASPAAISARQDGAQKDSKAAIFDLLTCEAAWPAGVQRSRVAGLQVPAPAPEIKRIVIIGDTGCRMKASENAFQPCNDPQKWPFAQIAESAAVLKPDLVIHLGDLHYRESPCPAQNPGCANSPWGYGFDAWQADFFNPAKPLLAAAPWVFVRGNHESCSRAGQGWFRFFDAQPWGAARSCDDPARDEDADYSKPYALPIGSDDQLLVFDSSKTGGKPFAASDPAHAKYLAQLKVVSELAAKKPNNLFLNHHPLLAVAPAKDASQFMPGGNAGLKSVFGALYPQRLFPSGVNVAMHGHIHMFEAISFKGDQPVSLVMGNSGSANEGLIAHTLPANAQLFPGAYVEDFAERSGFGFATLDRVDTGGRSDWQLTEYTASGRPVIKCAIVGSKSHCMKLDSPVLGGK
jgi:Calcineurin-like phosphoesterase